MRKSSDDSTRSRNSTSGSDLRPSACINQILNESTKNVKQASSTPKTELKPSLKIGPHSRKRLCRGSTSLSGSRKNSHVARHVSSNRLKLISESYSAQLRNTVIKSKTARNGTMKVFSSNMSDSSVSMLY